MADLVLVRSHERLHRHRSILAGAILGGLGISLHASPLPALAFTTHIRFGRVVSRRSSLCRLLVARNHRSHFDRYLGRRARVHPHLGSDVDVHHCGSTLAYRRPGSPSHFCEVPFRCHARDLTMRWSERLVALIPRFP